MATAGMTTADAVKEAPASIACSDKVDFKKVDSFESTEAPASSGPKFDMMEDKQDMQQKPFKVNGELLQDALDARHVCDESIELTAKVEAGNRCRLPLKRIDQVPQPMRIAAMLFQWQMTLRTKAPIGRFFESAQLFDVKCCGLEPGCPQPPEKIITMAAAAWLISYKYSKVQSDPFDFMHCNPMRVLADNATKVSMSMGGQSVTEQALLDEERATFRENFLDIGNPTVLTWLEMYMARLDVATAGVLSASGRLQEAMVWSEKMATTCVCYGPSSLQDSPMAWAQGILAMSLASDGLIPMDSIAPPGAKTESLAGTFPRGAGQTPAAVVPAMVTAALEFAVSSSMRGIRASTWKVMEVERQWQPFITQLHQRAAAC